MAVGYVDTSVLVAIAFSEPGSAALARRIRALDGLFAGTLLESEFLATAERERALGRARSLLDPIRFAHPSRRLTPEILAVLRLGHLRGADVHHLATALYLFPQPRDVLFLTLDEAQARVAARLGFRGVRELLKDLHALHERLIVRLDIFYPGSKLHQCRLKIFIELLKSAKVSLYLDLILTHRNKFLQ